MSESKNKKNSKIQNADRIDFLSGDGFSYDESLDLFGEHKTREQVKKEEKQRKKEERAALRQEMKKRREAAKAESTPTKRKDILVLGLVLLGIVLLCGLALANSLLRSSESMIWEHDESRGYILKTNANPEMSGAGPMADVLEVYFTNNDHLYVELVISNGADKPARIDAVDVQVYDNDTNELIAGGKVILEQELVIPVSDLDYYGFYISPEHVFVDGDTPLPEVCSFDIKIDSTPVAIE